MPEPDVAVIPAGDGRRAHPDRAHLIVEFSDSSLVIDRAKAALYAAAGVTEYWIVDLQGGAVEVCSEPQGDTYARKTRHGRGAVLQLPGFADVRVPVVELLPPA